MRIHLKNNPTKFHPDPIWNDGTSLIRFWRWAPQQENEEEEQQDE